MFPKKLITRVFFSLALFTACFCQAELSHHLKVDTGEKTEEGLRNIDFIYLINLDQRAEKLEKCLSQLKPYGISPHRFSAVNGWSLSRGALNDLGVKFLPGMLSGEWVVYFPLEGQRVFDFLREECYGKTFFSRWMTPGTIGCALSHLSVLQDAYDSGYQTIWIMEDDILVERDPRLLSSLIDKLNALVGKEGWDILYTDIDTLDKPLYTEENDFESDLKGDLWFFWRPDINLSDRSSFAKRSLLSEDFMKIGSRMRTHSMVISRSGMKKILEFEKRHRLFIPYDHELAIVPDIQMFSLRYDLVTHDVSSSDTQINHQEVAWENHKKLVLNELHQISGWQDPQKAEKIMEFIRRAKPKTCVEIGAFGGKMTYPIASTLEFLKQGTVYAIDAWDTLTAIEGLEDKKDIQWWKNINMNAVHQQFLELLSSKQLERCRPLHQRSQMAASLFPDESIDFLFIDGSFSRKRSLEDARLYLPKVKKGGYIWLNHAHIFSKNQTVAFLMKHCQWIKEQSMGIDCILFQKEKSLFPHVHEHGYWIGTEILNEHHFDRQLALALATFFIKEAAKNVVDFGCGPGDYVKLLRQHQIACSGYDGNPESPQISGGIADVLDLSQPFHLEECFDWVLSLEVGEHVPKEYERIFIENLHKHNRKGIVLSWAEKGQGGFGHFNEQDNSYIKEIMAQYGYENDLEAENTLRKTAQLPWFKNTIMVFRKKEGSKAKLRN